MSAPVYVFRWRRDEKRTNVPGLFLPPPRSRTQNCPYPNYPHLHNIRVRLDRFMWWSTAAAPVGLIFVLFFEPLVNSSVSTHERPVRGILPISPPKVNGRSFLAMYPKSRVVAAAFVRLKSGSPVPAGGTQTARLESRYVSALSSLRPPVPAAAVDGQAFAGATRRRRRCCCCCR